ncbi:hypothetical protein LPB19_10660 [Marinobacter salinisoli]|uniref:TIGR03016 family PEP-CTERM system-associated outer membrane protein n=1 Tax=Marinobacter salinisoli TaxID=2769486 RepID=A0ABX7MN49_9GAMM|nr:hypothetical protein [Marinobacter salinisoli]QSP93667.1 hypothetical protein LPB19_10660 [Marinobacter salinisoli]
MGKPLIRLGGIGFVPALLLYFTVPAGIAIAAPVNVSLGFDSRLTNNARKSFQDEEVDVESRLLLGIGHSSDTGRCNSDLLAQARYEYWLDETFDPETVGYVNFIADCSLGSNVVWRIEDYLDDVLQSSQSAGTPDDRSQKNIFRTGPIATFRLTSVDDLVLSAFYENTEYREPSFTDGERYTANIGWNHAFSQSFTAGLGASAERASLDTDEEIDKITVSVPITKEWAATRIAGSIGYSQLETSFVDRVQESDGVVGSFSLLRDINPTSTLSIEASRELTDQTSDFDVRFGEVIFDLEETSAVEVSAIQVKLEKRFGAGSSLAGVLFANQTDYLDIGNQETGEGARIEYIQPITRQMDARFEGTYDARSYTVDETEDQGFRGVAGIDFRLNSQLEMISQFGFERRTSDVETRGYDEAWFLFGLEYNL